MATTIRLGSYTKQVTKASIDKGHVIAQCVAVAKKHSLLIVVKRDHAGRWQGFCSRRNPNGARGWVSAEYENVPNAGRRARRIDNRANVGKVYVADTMAAAGPVEACKRG